VPLRGYGADVSGFRLLRSPWRFRFYEVKRLERPRCGKAFNHYCGVTSGGREVEFTIRIRPRG